ncbi:hypothetical protein [Streptomyces sp. NBC_00102]|uniref:hypothetical protein n=1 Tax=Streptomyces sp. NBC_00102 TaxID=2975652 RepID=UPI002259C5A1|nr:hypothetical protein [Streptomyces sp. NBC_00102]MCX5401008.1 hypothetical protein [Streptomyces sp. NBC_00102]
MTIPPICLDCHGSILGQVVVVVFGDNASGTRGHGYAHPAGASECLPVASSVRGKRRRWTAESLNSASDGASRPAPGGREGRDID